MVPDCWSSSCVINSFGAVQTFRHHNRERPAATPRGDRVMKSVRIVVNLVASVALIMLSAGRCTTAAEKQRADKTIYTRQAVFKLTYHNSDLVWLGDPASPNALAYPKNDA